MKAREAMPPLVKSETADTGKYKYRYADLPGLLDVALGHLREHGLTVTQGGDFDGTGFVLTTVIVAADGPWLSNVFRMPCGGRDPQAVGSAETYARRYSLMALLALAAEDDDGAAAMPKPESARQPAAKPQPPKAEPRPETKPANPPRPASEKPTLGPIGKEVAMLIDGVIGCPKSNDKRSDLIDSATMGRFSFPDLYFEDKAAEIKRLFDELADAIPYSRWIAEIGELRSHAATQQVGGQLI